MLLAIDSRYLSFFLMKNFFALLSDVRFPIRGASDTGRHRGLLLIYHCIDLRAAMMDSILILDMQPRVLYVRP
jgi:hypothetical protein